MVKTPVMKMLGYRKKIRCDFSLNKEVLMSGLATIV